MTPQKRGKYVKSGKYFVPNDMIKPINRQAWVQPPVRAPELVLARLLESFGHAQLGHTYQVGDGLLIKPRWRDLKRAGRFLAGNYEMLEVVVESGEKERGVYVRKDQAERAED